MRLAGKANSTAVSHQARAHVIEAVKEAVHALAAWSAVNADVDRLLLLLHHLWLRVHGLHLHGLRVNGLRLDGLQLRYYGLSLHVDGLRVNREWRLVHLASRGYRALLGTVKKFVSDIYVVLVSETAD